MRRILSRNPFSGKIYQEFDFISDKDLNAKIQKSEYGL